MSEAPKTQPKNNVQYPVSDQYKVLEGYDIYRSSKLIVALVVVEGNFGRDLRMYRWQLRGGEKWKVDLCRMSVADWQWEALASKAKEFIEKYEIRKRGSKAQQEQQQ